MNVQPAAVIEPVRVETEWRGATVNDTAASPVPAVVPTEIQSTFDRTCQPVCAPASTVKEPVPPADPKSAEYESSVAPTPSWVTVKTWPLT